MAIKRPDIYENNNSAYAFVDGDFVRGGIRTGVADLTALYALDPTPSAPDQFKENATIVYVSGETAYYVLVDINNIGNANGWEVFNSGSGSGTITGATNGLSLSGGGTEIALGGGDGLTGNTTINLNNYELQISTSGLTPSLIGIDPTGILILTSGSSVSMDTNEGLIYGSGYTSSNPNWIPTKVYVDGVAIGLNVHLAAWVATTGNTVLSGLTTIDGVLLQNGDRVLVKDQGDNTTNGIYSASTGVWGRTADYNFTPAGEIANGDLIPVTSGVTQYNSLWAQTGVNPIVSGDSVTFTLFSKPTIYIGGHGIDVNINTITFDGSSVDGNSLKWTGTTGNETLNVDITGGTLGTALNSKVDVAVYTGYTATSVSTVANVGSGATVYSGTSGTTALLRTIIGSGDTIVTQSGDTIIINSVGSSGTYDLSTPATKTVGGITAGEQLTGDTSFELFQRILAPYIPPTFSSFSDDIAACVEVGCQITGSHSFSWVFTDAGNVSGNTMCVRDVTSGVTLATNISTTSPQAVTIATKTFTTCGQTQQWCGSAMNTCGDQFNSSNSTVISYYPWYWGICTCPGAPGANRPTATCDMVIGGTPLLATSAGNVSPPFNSGGDDYLWFAVPSSVTDKTCWCLNTSVYGAIGGAVSPGGNLFPAPDSGISVTTSCWTTNYDVYISNKQSTTTTLKMGYA